MVPRVGTARCVPVRDDVESAFARASNQRRVTTQGQAARGVWGAAVSQGSSQDNLLWKTVCNSSQTRVASLVPRSTNLHDKLAPNLLSGAFTNHAVHTSGCVFKPSAFQPPALSQPTPHHAPRARRNNNSPNATL